GQPPMLAECLGILNFRPASFAILADRRFHGNTAVCIDGIAEAAQNGLRQAAIRIETHILGSAVGHDLAGITADEKQFTSLSLRLDDVLNIVVRPAIGEIE